MTGHPERRRAPGALRWHRIAAPHRPLLALTILAVLLYLPCLWNRALWSPGEPRYAAVAEAMVTRSDFVVPHLNGAVCAEKPPLFFWLGIAAAALPGITLETGTRVVSVVASFGTLLLTFFAGRRFFDAATGWGAALVLGTSSLFVTHASSGVIDALLSFLVVAATLTGMRARETGSVVPWAAFYLICAAAILTKGPVGLILPAGVLLLMTLQEEGVAALRSRHALWGIALCGTVVSLWLVPAIVRGGDSYASVILFRQNLLRAVASWDHMRPAGYLAAAAPAAFLPWVVFLPGGILSAVRTIRSGRHESARGARLALTWSAFTIVFFSLLSGKKTRYLLPMMPAMSLLVALELRPFVDSIRLPARAAVGVFLCAIVPAVPAGALLLVAGGIVEPVSSIDGLAPDQEAALAWYAAGSGRVLLAVAGGAVLVPALMSMGAALRRFPGGVTALLASAVLTVAAAQWILVPAVDVIKSPRPFTMIVGDAAARGTLLQFPGDFSGTFNVLLSAEVIPVERHLEGAVSRIESRPDTTVLAKREHMSRLRERLPRLSPPDCRRLGGHVVCVSRPEAEGTR